MDPVTAITGALLALGFPGIVIAMLCVALVFVTKALLQCQNDHRQTTKDLNHIRIQDFKKILEDQQNLGEAQAQAINRLASSIKREKI